MSRIVINSHCDAQRASSVVSESSPTVLEYEFQRWTVHDTSPDITQSDYFLFRYLKKDMRGHRFSSDIVILADVLSGLERREPNFYMAGISSLPM